MVEFSFKVGAGNQHEVSIYFSRWSGRIRIRVDGRVVIQKLLLSNFTDLRRYELTVGDTEPQRVVIEQRGRIILPPFRMWTFRVYGAGLLGEYVGGLRKGQWVSHRPPEAQG